MTFLRSPLLLLLTLAFVPSGCSSTHALRSGGEKASEPDLTARSESRWQASALRSYRFEYAVTGAATGPYRGVVVHVKEGVVTSVDDVGEARPLPRGQARLYPTIPELLRQIRRELENDNVTVTVRYDEHLGFPVSAYFDAGQEGDGFEVAGLREEP